MEMVKKFFSGISRCALFFALCSLAHSPLILTVSTLTLSLAKTVSHTFASLSVCNYFVFVISSVLCCVSLFPFLSVFQLFFAPCAWHFYRRLPFVVFFHNRFICRIAVILLFRLRLCSSASLVHSFGSRYSYACIYE